MSSFTLTVAVLLGLVVRLASMREVRAAHIVLGRKLIDTSPKPPSIERIYLHEQNTDVCNQYFYSRLAIRYTFGVCLLATSTALLVGLLGAGFPAPTQTLSPPPRLDIDASTVGQATWPALLLSADGQDADIVNVKHDQSYVAIVSENRIRSFVPVEDNRPVLLVLDSDGGVSIIGGTIRVVQLLLFVGVIAGLLCWLIAGKIKAVEEAMSQKEEG